MRAVTAGNEDTSTTAELGEQLVTPAARSRILSAGRLKLTLTLFMAAVLLSLSALMFSGVDRIFSWLTPSIRKDLQHKALHGAVELAQSTQFGVLTGDTNAIAEAVTEYDNDQDVTGLLVSGTANGRVLYSKAGLPASAFAALLRRARGHVHDLGKHYGTWMTSEIEGAAIGTVAVLVSKARLDAGEELRREVLRLAALGCLAALVASLLFVSMYIGPILRVTGETFERLERRTEEALAAARLKSQFLANMSHEIRTPMNGIIGVLDLLNRTQLSPKQRRYSQTIDSSARGLLTIINDILDFSKLEAGKYEVRQDDFDLTQLVQDATELLSPRAHGKGLDLVVRTSPDLPECVKGDGDRIKQVIINLLGNAVKFTERGHIELHVSVDETAPDYLLLRFAVTDTGVGISPEDQARLFGVFSQVDGSLTRKYGGTGLGLAISKRIAEAMGGQCGVVSEVGTGSTFWFTARVGHSDSKATLQVRPSRLAVRVLLASSSEPQRLALCELLQRWGMECELASTPEKACEMVIQHAPELTVALVDSGIQTSGPGAPDLGDLCVAEGVPVIRLLSTTEVAAQSSASSVQAFLWKPVRASELYNGILALTAGKDMELRSRDVEIARVEEVAGSGRVLVVDDNEVNRLVACELLTELGYESDTACNGREAFEKVRDHDYDVVLMDCQMPEVDGFQGTQLIRQLPGDKARVPIIALTAHALVEDRDRVLRGGMDDYASKPIRGRVLASLLRRWIPSTAPGPASAGSVRAEAAVTGNAAPALEAAPAQQSANAELLDPTLPRSPRVASLFLQLVPGLVAELSAAVAGQDVVTVKKIAHKLKGNCLSLGASRMAAVCHDLELAAAAGRVDREVHARIAPELAAVTPVLNQLLEAKPENDSKAASA